MKINEPLKYTIESLIVLAVIATFLFICAVVTNFLGNLIN